MWSFSPMTFRSTTRNEISAKAVDQVRAAKIPWTSHTFLTTLGPPSAFLSTPSQPAAQALENPTLACGPLFCTKETHLMRTTHILTSSERAVHTSLRKIRMLAATELTQSASVFCDVFWGGRAVEGQYSAGVDVRHKERPFRQTHRQRPTDEQARQAEIGL